MKFLERTPPKNDKNGPLAETEQDRKSSRIIYKRTREEIGMGEPNDSPEIPDRGKTSDIPGLPSEGGRKLEPENFILQGL